MWLFMGIELLTILGTLVSSKTTEQMWTNSLYKDLDFNCPPGHHLSRLTWSTFNDKQGPDVRWKFECSSRSVIGDKCHDIVYQYPEIKCPDNGVAVGVSGRYIFDLSKGEIGRQYNIKCCKPKLRNGTNCRNVSTMNFDASDFDYAIPLGAAIQGFNLTNNGRIWEILVCDFPICVADSMKFRDPVKMTPGSIKVVGIATSQGCGEGVQYSTSLERDATKVHSSSVEHASETSFTFGVSIGVSFGTDVFGVEFGFSFSETISGGFSSSHSTSEGSSVSVTSGSGQTLKFKGPGAALIIAHTREYHGKAQSAVAEYSVTCENGEKYKESHKVSLEASTYSHINYLMRIYDYDAKDCTPESETCLEKIKGGDAVDINKIVSSFKKCIKILTNDTGKVNYLIN